MDIQENNNDKQNSTTNNIESTKAKVFQFLQKNNTLILVSLVMLTLVMAIVLVLNTNTNSTPKNNTTEPSLQDEPVVIPDDIDTIQGIVEDANKSDIEIISNKNNEQAEIILENLGIDIKNLNSYAGSIDSRQESAHIILILRPKPEFYDDISLRLSLYCGEKQSYFINNNMEDTELCELAKGALVCELDEYIIVVLEKDAPSILQEIVSKLDNNEIQLENVSSETENNQ